VGGDPVGRLWIQGIQGRATNLLNLERTTIRGVVEGMSISMSGEHLRRVVDSPMICWMPGSQSCALGAANLLEKSETPEAISTIPRMTHDLVVPAAGVNWGRGEKSSGGATATGTNPPGNVKLLEAWWSISEFSV